MIKYLKLTIRTFLGLDTDYDSLFSNQKELIETLDEIKNLEIQNQELIIEEERNYSNYLTLRNFLLLLFFLGFIGGGFWLYNADFFNDSVVKSIKSFESLLKNFNNQYQNDIFEAIDKLNENSVNFNKEEIKLLLEIKNLLLKKEIDGDISPGLKKELILKVLLEKGVNVIWDKKN